MTSFTAAEPVSLPALWNIHVCDPLCHLLMMNCDTDMCSGILAMLLNDGKDAATGKQVLQPSTVALMFTNQIPQFPDHGRQGIPAAKSELTNPIPDMYPTATPGEPQGWGLSMQLSSGPTGRGGGTGWWTGLANLFWWVDREKGIAGMVASQVLPFLDAKVIGTWVQAEAAVYEALANGGMTVERE